MSWAEVRMIEKAIRGMRSLQASDELYMTLEGTERLSVHPKETATFPWGKVIKPYTSGSLKLKINYNVSDVIKGYYPTVKLKVYINDTLKQTISLRNGQNSTEPLLLYFNADDEITLEISMTGHDLSSGRFIIYDVEVYGTLTEFNALNIKEV